MNPTDILEGALLIVAIAIWGFWKYRERELLHKKAIFDLQRNAEVRTRELPNWGKVATTAGAFTFLIIIMVVGGILFVYNPSFRSFMFHLLPVELALVAFLLLMMVIRDVKILKRS